MCDDAAGLAVANAYRNETRELAQGVSNANDGIGQRQIADSGLSNISLLLDPLRTLATQSGFRYSWRVPRHPGRRVPADCVGNQSAGGPTAETLTVHAAGSDYSIALNSSTSGNQAADTVAHLVASLNAQLLGSGVYAANSGNNVTLQSAGQFTVTENSYAAGPASVPGTGSLGDLSSGFNFSAAQPFTPFTAGWSPQVENLLLTIRGIDHQITLTSATSGSTAAVTIDHAIQSINTQLSTQCVNDVTAGKDGSGNVTLTAVGRLGSLQGVIGAGTNRLNYAISLAQTQITNFSAAQSRIRDADIAEEAAVLTKVQILLQASVAAMAQANSEALSILRLLR